MGYNIDTIINKDLTSLIEDDLAFDPALINIPRNVFEDTSTKGSSYSSDEKILAVIVYTCTGSLAKTAKLTNINYATIMNWRNTSDWWWVVKQEVDKVRNEILEAKLTQVVHSATDQLLDRITKGDAIYDMQSGETVRIPVKAKDLSEIGISGPLEKINNIREQAMGRKDKKTIEDHLKQIADTFKEISQGLKPKNEPVIIEGSYSEAVENN